MSESQGGFSAVFQGGLHKVITISATAGNVTTNLSPTARRRWLILRGKIRLVTDATVANRYIEGNIQGDGTNVSMDFYESAVVTASLTRNLNHGEDHLAVTAVAGMGGQVGYIGHRPILIEGSGEYSIFIASGVVGDSYSGYVEVLEMEMN